MPSISILRAELAARLEHCYRELMSIKSQCGGRQIIEEVGGGQGSPSACLAEAIAFVQEAQTILLTTR